MNCAKLVKAAIARGLPLGKACVLQCTCKAYRALTCRSVWSWRNFCMTGLKDRSSCFSCSNCSLVGAPRWSSPSDRHNSAEMYCRKLKHKRGMMYYTTALLATLWINRLNFHTIIILINIKMCWSPYLVMRMLMKPLSV